MTFVTSFPIHLSEKHHCLHPPRSLEAHDVSLVVPVRDNQRGLETLLNSLLEIDDPSCSPAEIVVVDNNSRHSVHISSRYREHVPIKLLRCNAQGPANARNVGAHHASGCWLWFCDCDCVLSNQSLAGYRRALNGAIGYAGWIQSARSGVIRQYYEDQQILIPPDVVLEADVERPAYVITANTLIYQPAFQAIGSFRSAFAYAAGEDVDLGLRLWDVGALSYAPDAVVFHDIEPDLLSFMKRFIRYGRGNRSLSHLYDVDLTPRPFVPRQWKKPVHWTLAMLQWTGLWLGYMLERREPAKS